MTRCIWLTTGQIHLNAFHGETDDRCVDLRDQHAERGRYKYNDGVQVGRDLTNVAADVMSSSGTNPEIGTNVPRSHPIRAFTVCDGLVGAKSANIAFPLTAGIFPLGQSSHKADVAPKIFFTYLHTIPGSPRPNHHE